MFDDIQNLQDVDDIKGNLFVGQIQEVPGTVTFGDDSTVDVLLWGQILFYGFFEDETIIVERLRRFSLFGRPVEPEYDNARVRTLSLAGPRNQQDSEPSEPGSGVFSDLILQLHYTALSQQYDPRFESDDAVFPRLERVQTQLEWFQQDGAEKLSLTFALIETIIERDEEGFDLIAALDIPDFTVTFRQSNPEPQIDKNIMLFSSAFPKAVFAGGCMLEPCSANFDTKQHTLNLHFVNLSPLFDTTNLDVLVGKCNEQFKAACTIWGRKARLNLFMDVNEDLDLIIFDAEVAHKNLFATPDSTTETGIPALGYGTPVEAGTVEIYIVTALADRPLHNGGGGGVAHDAGVESAYCILGLDGLWNNPNLLAHELGHVLGLSHFVSPPVPDSIFPGSSGSIMDPGNPNPELNTMANFGIFFSGQLNPIVWATTIDDCFQPG